MDQFDRASALEQREREAAIARRQKPAMTDSVIAAETCIDCNDAIPAERRQACPGARRCAHCQAQHEERRP